MELYEILHGTDNSDYLEQYKGFRQQKHVLEYLSAHLSAALRIQDIAAALETPAHQLSRSFRRDTGYGLKEYMEQMLLKSWQEQMRFINIGTCFL